MLQSLPIGLWPVPVFLLCFAGCQPHQWVADTPGIERSDMEELPAATTTGEEPVMTHAALVIDDNAGYFEFHTTSVHALEQINIEIEDEIFVATIDDLQEMTICDWLNRSSGSVTDDLLGSIWECTEACSDACALLRRSWPWRTGTCAASTGGR